MSYPLPASSFLSAFNIDDGIILLAHCALPMILLTLFPSIGGVSLARLTVKLSPPFLFLLSYYEEIPATDLPFFPSFNPSCIFFSRVTFLFFFSFFFYRCIAFSLPLNGFARTTRDVYGNKGSVPYRSPGGVLCFAGIRKSRCETTSLQIGFGRRV